MSYKELKERNDPTLTRIYLQWSDDDIPGNFLSELVPVVATDPLQSFLLLIFMSNFSLTKAHLAQLKASVSKNNNLHRALQLVDKEMT